jgi:hypothetical protein
MLNLRTGLLAAALAIAPAFAWAQSASGVATGGTSVAPGSSSATVGSGGSGAAGDTSATSLGTAGTSTGEQGTSSSMGVGGSAAAVDGKTQSKSHVNPNATNGHAKAQANAGGGEWSKSMTHTKDHKGEVSSRTKSMAHEPGAPPAKSTVESTQRAPATP